MGLSGFCLAYKQGTDCPLFWTIFKACLHCEHTWKKGGGLLENRESLLKALEGKDGVFLQNKGKRA